MAAADNYENAGAILGTRDSYTHALSPVERVLGHFLWDPGLMNVALRRQKMDLPVTLISGPKNWLHDQLCQSNIYVLQN